jgi:hypothetical protein
MTTWPQQQGMNEQLAELAAGGPSNSPSNLHPTSIHAGPVRMPKWWWAGLLHSVGGHGGKTMRPEPEGHEPATGMKIRLRHIAHVRRRRDPSICGTKSGRWDLCDKIQGAGILLACHTM